MKIHQLSTTPDIRSLESKLSSAEKRYNKARLDSQMDIITEKELKSFEEKMLKARESVNNWYRNKPMQNKLAKGSTIDSKDPIAVQITDKKDGSLRGIMTSSDFKKALGYGSTGFLDDYIKDFNNKSNDAVAEIIIQKAKGGRVDDIQETWYISYLSKKNNFRETKKEFEGEDAYEQAVKWGRKNLPNFNLDMVRKKFKTGGTMDSSQDDNSPLSIGTMGSSMKKGSTIKKADFRMYDKVKFTNKLGTYEGIIIGLDDKSADVKYHDENGKFFKTHRPLTDLTKTSNYYKKGSTIESEKVFEIKYHTPEHLKQRGKMRGSMKAWVKAKNRDEVLSKIKSDKTEFGDFAELISIKPTIMSVDMFKKGGYVFTHKGYEFVPTKFVYTIGGL